MNQEHARSLANTNEHINKKHYGNKVKKTKERILSTSTTITTRPAAIRTSARKAGKDM